MEFPTCCWSGDQVVGASMMIDNMERNHKPGMISGYKAGEGNLSNYSRSMRKGEAGNPSLLYRLANLGLSAHPYRTYFGSGIRSFQRIT